MFHKIIRYFRYMLTPRNDGNFFEYHKSNYKKCKYDVSGTKNKFCSKQAIFINSKFDYAGNNNLAIFNNSKIKNTAIMCDGDNNQLIVGNNCVLNGVIIWFGGCNNKIIVGDNTVISQGCELTCGNNNELIIGNSCLFAKNCHIFCTDGHKILSKDGKRLNEDKNISIGNHVLIFHGSYVLKGSKIGDNSVVGSKSSICGSNHKANSLIVGTPAETIKEDITWEE